jgi:hypothetical protein
VIQDLAKDLKPVNADPRLKSHLNHALTIADGTVLDAISKVSAAMWLPFQDGTSKHAWKLHVQLDFDTFFPTEVELTDARNSGKSDEKNVLRKKLKKDHCYVTDRSLVRPVHALQRHQPHRQQLRLPGQGEQRLWRGRGAAAVRRGAQGRRGT